MNKVNNIELLIEEWFGGVGAYTQAMKKLGLKFRIHNYIENNEHSVNSYNVMNDTNFKPTDINDVDVSNYPELDILVAGWPCQDYSIAGLGKGLDGTRSSLILLTIDKIRQMRIKPKYILLENVKGLLSKKHTQDLEFIKECFEEIGYQWSQAMLNSKYFGVPQSRERVYMLLTRNDLEKVDIKHLENRNTIEKVLRDVLDFSVPTETIKLSTILESDYGKGVKKEYSNYIYLPPTNPEKPLNNLEGRRLWKTDKYVGTIPAGTPPKVYFTNTMKQYTGKIIELDLNKLENQKRGEINKIATLGTLEEKTFKKEQNGKPLNTRGVLVGVDGVNRTLTTRAIDGSEANKIIFMEHKPIKSFGKRSKYGIDGQINTLTTRSDHDNQIIFKEHSFNQKKHFLGLDGVSKTLRAGDCDSENKILYNEDLIIHYRKLTTLETWRLMGFSDEMHNKVVSATKTLKNGKTKRLVSDSQLAKQAGNSIVVDVLVEIIKTIFNKGV